MHWKELQEVLPDEHYDALLQYCIGYTVRFPKADIEKERIVVHYKKLMNMNVKKSTAVKILSSAHGKSVNRIYEIVRDV